MGRRRTQTKKSKKLKLKRTLRMQSRTLGNILMFSGVFLMAVSSAIPKFQYINVQSQEPVQGDVPLEQIAISIDSDTIQVDQKLLNAKKDSKTYPLRVVIPSLQIDVRLEPAKVVNGKWEVFEKTGSYGIGSGVPGEAGNSVVFAHARDGLFLPLKSVKEGAIIYVFTNDKWYTYKAQEIKEVLPHDVSVIAPTEDETLTLYTCTGFADSKRLIVTAKREI
jgi:LPXTG-site transpeptidase (sortase) family protein